MRKVYKRYSQHKGEILAVSHDFGPFLSAHSTTLSSAAAQNIDSGLTVQNEATGSGQWSGQLNTQEVGNFTYELKGVFADGQQQVLEFAVSVFDESLPVAGYR